MLTRAPFFIHADMHPFILLPCTRVYVQWNLCCTGLNTVKILFISFVKCGVFYICIMWKSIFKHFFLHTDGTNNRISSFLGFSLYVSNSTNRLRGTLCFRDTQFNKTTIPEVFNTTCNVFGQYIIYYNERLPGVDYPCDYNINAENDLCEVEVYGKRRFIKLQLISLNIDTRYWRWLYMKGNYVVAPWSAMILTGYFGLPKH